MRRTLLIVDDNQINRKLLIKILDSEYNILEAENGKEALEKLHEQYKSISVVLLDIIMPVMDGYEVLNKMRNDTFLSQIPVIVASGDNREYAEVKALSLGANDYILKPYKPEIIRHRIFNTIYLRETSSFANSVQNDALTGVYGKEYFYLQATEILQNNPQKQYDLICFDVERFKLINDIYGTQMGDALLKKVGAMLLEIMENDIICGRIGADEFVCLLPHREDYSNETFASYIAKIAAFSDAVKLNIVLRYGVYVIDDPTTSVSIMCDRASLAKESIKGKYDTYFAFYDDKIRQKLLDEQIIVSAMKNALQEKQFKIYFQPKYDLKTDEIVGAEALVRWQHPEKGFMSPGEFVPLFEKNGFITDLDLFIWEQCCQKMKEWRDKGKKVAPISVNVSRVDIYNPRLAEILLSMIQKYELSPKYLHLEITETAYTQNPEQLISTVQKLKKLGFMIEMDDFGTGYSSLNMLAELPIDILKLDMRFLQKEEKKNQGRSVLSFIISLAKWMDLQVVAEGVETKEQMQLLKSLNCEYAQGYYYAKPMPENQFERHMVQSAAQHLQLSAKDHAPLLQSAKDKRPVMVVMDDAGEICAQLRKAFDQEYRVQEIEGAVKAKKMLCEQNVQVNAVMLHLTKSVTAKQVQTMLECCKKIHAPVIVLYDKIATAQNKILAMDIADYIALPCDTTQLKLRTRNAIAFARMEKFEQEKEINAAIIEMRKRAERDVLTELLNRAEFEVRIDHFFYHNDNPEGIFIILDIDNFKTINDNFGHVNGDKAIYAVAQRLEKLFPETDIIGRIGGDEFALFIPYMLSETVLHQKMEKLCAATVFENERLTISCSAGVCFTPEFGITHKDLYKNADIALLAAKRKGKSGFEIFNKDMKLPIPSLLEEKTERLLDNVSDAMFVSDAVTSQIIYINETACNVLKKDKAGCLNKRCYELFWDRCQRCDRCTAIDANSDAFYEENTYLKDQQTPVLLKARVEEWDNRKVKVHYLKVEEQE